jgi:hypothetical protein
MEGIACAGRCLHGKLYGAEGRLNPSAPAPTHDSPLQLQAPASLVGQRQRFLADSSHLRKESLGGLRSSGESSPLGSFLNGLMLPLSGEAPDQELRT